jgi:hypothetical protein
MYPSSGATAPRSVRAGGNVSALVTIVVSRSGPATHGDAEVCYADPGDDPDVHVTAESLAFVEWHRGALSWSAARRESRITAIGPRHLVRALGAWNLHAPVAPRS